MTSVCWECWSDVRYVTLLTGCVEPVGGAEGVGGDVRASLEVGDRGGIGGAADVAGDALEMLEVMRWRCRGDALCAGAYKGMLGFRHSKFLLRLFSRYILHTPSSCPTSGIPSWFVSDIQLLPTAYPVPARHPALVYSHARTVAVAM